MRRSKMEFIDSYRAAIMEPTTEELKLETLVESDDPFGEKIARILNQTRPFQSSRQQTNNSDPSGDDSALFRPLLSRQNWKLVKPQLIRILKEFTSQPRQKVQSIIRKQWRFFFWNTKSIGTFFGLFFAVLTISLMASASITTLASLWYLNFIWIVISIALSSLIDFHEVQRIVPKPLQRIISQVVSIVQWIDNHVLQGIRYKGREWNKSDFEWQDGKSAQSSNQYLWTLPPPSIRERNKTFCFDENQDTTQHAAAIDYCYDMLRESFVRNKYSKLRKAVLKRKEKLGPVVSTTEKNGHTIAYTSELNTPRNAAVGASSGATPRAQNFGSLEVDTSPFPETNACAFEESMGALQVKSPTDAVEVIRKRHQFVLHTNDTIREVRSDESIPHDVRNEILKNDDMSVSQTTHLPRRDGPEGTENSKEALEADMKWMDVGAEIGLKLLGSAAVQRVMTSHDTAERINTIKENFGGGRKTPDSVQPRQLIDSAATQPTKPLSHPVHSMWTSATSAAALHRMISPLSSMDADESMVADESPSKIQLQDQSDSHALIVQTDLPESGQTAPKAQHLQSVETTRKFSPIEQSNSKHELENAHASPEISSSRGSPTLNLTRKASVTPDNMTSMRIMPVTPRTPRMKTVEKRPKLLPGVKIVVPLFPLQPNCKPSRQLLQSSYQMATVVSSRRLCVGAKKRRDPSGAFDTNCLSVTAKLDKSFLRGGEFAELTFRVMDEWGGRYMPKHSKVPLGSCVATRFGLGVLVAWRVEDDCHIVRSLWQRRGPGSTSAYLHRDAIYSTVEAAVGFKVKTTQGNGTVVAYKNGAKDFRGGKYFVKISEEGSKHYGQSIEVDRSEVLSCPSAQFIPVIEHIREAAKYRLQLFDYKESLEASKRDVTSDPLALGSIAWQNVSKWSDMLWKSFLRAIEEDEDFDEGMNEFISTMVSFLDNLDSSYTGVDYDAESSDNLIITASNSMDATESEKLESPWVYDVFGIFGFSESPKIVSNESIEVEWLPTEINEDKSLQKSYNRIFGVIRTMMRTIAITRAACVDEPDFKLALSICHEVLLFVKTVIRVQQKNTNPYSIKVWKRALEEIASTFGPAKERLERIWQGIAERMEQQGKRAKVRILRFVDIIVQDDVLLLSIEQGDWGRCCEHLELALVKAQIIDEENREHYHRTAKFLFDHFANASSRSGLAGARNNEKVAHFALFIQCLASPKRSFLKIFLEDGMHNTIERILVRVFQDEVGAARMLSIHAQNFHSLRQFRMLKDFTIAGKKFWMPLLDAADAELTLIVSRMPEGTKEYIGPLSKLFSLCIVEFHKISDGDLTNHWLDFFMEEEAINIIHDIDMKLILALESFSRDVREMMIVLPYYPR